jgi:hypothetical protein
MEGHLKTFCAEQGMEESEMYKRVRAATSENELAQMIVELVLCCADYECFVDIMKHKNRQMEMEERYSSSRHSESKW